MGDTLERDGGQPVLGGLDGAVNVLVLSDSMDPDARASYYERLLPAVPADLYVLAVEYTRGPDGWLDEWCQHAGALPAETSIISVSDGARSTTTTSAETITCQQDGTEFEVTPVESPDDLTGLGIAVGSHLKRWEDVPGTVLLTLDSLTVLSQYVDLKRMFRFLHVVVNRVKAAGGVGHFHMDPAAHDDQTIATLTSVFDAVARYDDGEWQVSAR